MSGTRSPKDLKLMITSNHGQAVTGEEVIPELAKLRGLSADDKTENALLRNRIEQQSELIMTLKQRADEVSQELQTSERIRRELEDFREHAQGAIAIEVQKYKMLDARFNDLANNHQEMIKFKDQYKLENQQLRLENARLKEDNEKMFSAALEEKEAIIVDLEKQLQHLTERNNGLEAKAKDSYDAMIENRTILQERLQKTEDSLTSTIHELERKLLDSENKLRDINKKYKLEHSRNENQDEENRSRLTQLSKEKDELLQLVMQRGKIIEEKGAENRKLEVRLEEIKNRLKAAEERFEKEAAAVDANIQVIKLRKELAETENHMSDVDRKFEAYKNHTNKLLQQERELNAKLRHLAG